MTGNPGNYIFTVVANGYQTFTSSVKISPRGTLTANINLNGNPKTISGTVSGPDPGATTLDLFLNNILIQTTNTDSSNQYSFQNVAPGNYVVSASALTYATQSLGAVVMQSSDTPPLNFTMIQDKGALTGNVKNQADNQPIPNAVVQVKINGTVVQQAITDSFGNYTILDLQPRTYNVVVNATDFSQQILGVEIIKDSTVSLNFTLVPTPGSLKGHVYNQQSEPIVGGLIQLYFANAVVFSTFTALDGSYEITGIAPPGTYTAVASALNYGTAVQGVFISSVLPTTLNFILVEDAGTLTGKVTDNLGDNLPGVLLQAILENVVVGNVLTDSSGNYTFLNLAPNNYVINPILINYGSTPKGITIISGPNTLNFELLKDAGTLTGKVTDNLENNLSGVFLQAILNNIVVGTSITDNSGNYTFLNLAPNNYVINPILINYGSTPKGIRIISGPNTLNFELLEDAGTLTGNVKDDLGNNLSGVFLEATLDNIFIATVLTDGYGNYTFLTLAKDKTYEINPTLVNYVGDPKEIELKPTPPNILNFVLIEILAPPRDLVGIVNVNQFLLKADRIHVLRWQPSITANIFGYKIFRNNSIIKIISATDALVFEDHNRSYDQTDVYQVCSFRGPMNISAFSSVSLR
jgi:hypothetical protein